MSLGGGTGGKGSNWEGGREGLREGGGWPNKGKDGQTL